MEEIGPNLKKGHRVLDSATVSSLNLLQSRRVAAGEGQCIILAVELSTRLRPLCACLRTAVSLLEGLVDAVMQVGDSLRTGYNVAS